MAPAGKRIHIVERPHDRDGHPLEKRLQVHKPADPMQIDDIGRGHLVENSLRERGPIVGKGL
jgi:hypothetical protein